MVLNFFEIQKLDEKLSPFRRWDIVASVKWDLIWVFESVGYHGGRPDIEGLWNYIFAEFEKWISRQWSNDWRVIDSPLWDDDTYIDRRKSTLSEWYRLATQKEKELLKTLLEKKEREKKPTRKQFDEQLSKLQALWKKLWLSVNVEEINPGN